MENMKAKEKKKYNKPEISIIKIDNEISLVLMSANPSNDPFESSLQKDNSNIDPFKTSKA